VGILFKGFSIKCRCPRAINTLAPKRGTLQTGLKKPNGYLLENVSNNIDEILIAYGDCCK
jgi:hypothetical protein